LSMFINSPFVIEVFCSPSYVCEVGSVSTGAVTLLVHQLEENHRTHCPEQSLSCMKYEFGLWYWTNWKK
jgi:hypothetical protein